MTTTPGERRCALGIDFGTESARAVLVSLADGRTLASTVHAYEHGVIDTTLPTPDDDVALGPDWALQDPADYVRAIQALVPPLLPAAGVAPVDVVGVGVDVTSCTILPTLADGTPLCFLDELRRSPHAWVKLWKHHAAQPQADRLNALAEERREAFLPRYGGRTSSEWFYPKALQLLEEAPDLYARAARIVEATDWIVWQLTGHETRNSCTAGYKALWSKQAGFPPEEFFAALHPGFRHVVDDKLSRRVLPLGASAGGLSADGAAWTGLLPGTPVAVGNVDAHVSAPAAGVTEPGAMVIIMGTSNCHILLGDRESVVGGMCGVVEDGVVPGRFGYEAGQPAVGDLLAWYTESSLPPEWHARARQAGTSVHGVLEEQAARLRPGESGLLALDWWNGNRSVLVDAELSGLLVGMTLATRPPEVYRALIEATAFGTRTIVDAFDAAGVAVERIVTCGGLPDRNRLLMQCYADITGHELAVAASSQTPALGAAMFGAVAAGSARGGFDSIVDASRHMAHLRDETFRPVPAHLATYDRLYGEYRRLHDRFGRGGDDVMRTLRQLRRDAVTR